MENSGFWIITRKLQQDRFKPEQSPGLAILIDRLWLRGVSKEDAKLDEWDKELAPSTESRK